MTKLKPGGRMCKKCCLIVAAILIGLAIIAVPAQAEQRPIQISLFTPVQIFPEEDPIVGLRLNLLYGRSASVTGLDLGWLVNHTTTGKSKALQIGFVGINEAEFVGVQWNTINITTGNVEGLQWGFFNYANYANGLQLGFINYANTMKGLQIGLINVIKQGGALPVLPIINWSF